MLLAALQPLTTSGHGTQGVADGCGQLTTAVRSRRVRVSRTAAVRSTSTTLPVFDTDSRQTKRRGRPPKHRTPDWQQGSHAADSQQEAANLPVSSNDNGARSNIHSNDANRRRSRRLFPATIQQHSQHPDRPTSQPGDPSSTDAATHTTELTASAAAQHQPEAAHARPADAVVAKDVEAPSPASGDLPPERVWRQELRPFSGLMSDPNKPWVQPFILKHCYVVNTPETREKFVALTPAEMHKVLKWRLQVEMRLVKLANSLSAAWRRLQLLSAAVGDQGQVLTIEQLNKEREQIVALLDSVKEGQKFLVRAVTAATELDDQRYLTKAGAYRQLLVTMMATMDSYLREYLRRIGSASRINSRSQKKWQETPEPLRQPLHVLEGRRQQQLLELQSLCPEHPTQQLADYRAVAIKFEMYQDNLLKQRKPATGQPSSTGGIFWQQSSTDGTLPNATSTAAANLGPGAAAVPTNKQQQIALKASWKQNPQQLMARPLQQLPLLPHLGKHRHWLPQLERQQQQQLVAQREVALQLQLQAEAQQQQQVHEQMRDLGGEEQQQQQQQQQHAAADQELQQQQRLEQMRAARLDPDSLQRPSYPTASSAYPFQDLRSPQFGTAGIDGLPGSNTVHQDQIGSPGVNGPMFSYSGKVIPPLPVLLQRALQLEKRLIAEEDRKREMFAANNAYVKSQRERQW